MRKWILLLFTAFTILGGIQAQEPTVDGDTITISLLTCEPHDEVYSLYGHTALRFRSTSGKLDWAVNYGVFDFATPNFVMRFVLGKTDYMLGVFPFKQFHEEYDSYGSRIYEQQLNLSKAEKESIYSALYQNAKPENREYRYNFFYDNCTTRARNLILHNIDGYIEWNNVGKQQDETYRDIIHKYNADNPWSRFGSDLLLGIGSDIQLTPEQKQFLPDNLMKDFADAQVKTDTGTVHPLVDNTIVFKPHHPPMQGGSFPLSPIICAALVLLVTIAVTIYELRRRRFCWGLDLFLMILSGLPGLILTVMMFSEHPTVRVNLQWLVLNPLPLIFAWQAITRRRRGQKHWLWSAWTALLLAGLIGSFFQHYAEGLVLILRASLIRSVMGMRVKTSEIE